MTNFWYIRPTVELWFIERKFKYLHVTKKKEKGDFHEFDWVKDLSYCTVFLNFLTFFLNFLS